MEEFDITRIEGGRAKKTTDVVSREVPFTLNLNGEELLVLLASPADLEDLVAGFLFSSGLIRSGKDIERITIDEERWLADVHLTDRELSPDLVFRRMYTSGCGRGTLFYSAVDMLHRRKNESPFTIAATEVLRLMSEFNERSEVFRRTGGVHYAALSDGNTLLLTAGDIGRHNAVDKVIGKALGEELDFSRTMFLTSGRISSEIILKIQKTGSPVLVSRSAPTDQGVRLARELGITLVGFARGLRMNVYSNEERISSPDLPVT